MPDQISSLNTVIRFKDTPIGKIPLDWEVVKLRDVAKKFYNGGTPDTTNKDYWDGNIPWITGADFDNQKVSQIRRYITAEGLRNSSSNLIPKGNILVVTRTGVGKVAIAPFDIAISQDITGVVLDENKASPAFIYWHLVFNSIRLRTTIQGTSISGLLRGDLEILNFALPPLPEQEKIIKILSTVDEAIEKTAQIIEKTKEVKKALMQKLFIRGIGHKKFKKTEIGEIPVEWEVIRFKEITEKFYNGGTPDTKRKSYWGGDIPWVTGADFEGQKVKRIRRYITHEGLENSATNIIPKGNLLIVTRTGVGKLAIAPFDIAISQDITGATLDSKKALPGYIFWYLDFKSEWLKSIIQGTSINGLLREDLELFAVPLPGLDEQKQIAENLFSVDGEIEKELIHKAHLEILKKGLMKVLLTGQIRVTE